MRTARLTLNKSPLYEQVADQLEGLIMSDYRSGDRLPSEQALASQTNVSRTIIREALKILKERGLIDSRTGSGAYVTKPEAQNVASVMARIIQIENMDAESIYDTREILESAAVRRAARLATETDIADMRATLRNLEDRAIAPDTRRDLDFYFHYLIAKASRNPLLALLIETMSGVFKEVIQTGIFIQGGIDDGIVRHRRILAAIESRDEEKADQMMREHLEKSLENYHDYLTGKRADGAPERIRMNIAERRNKFEEDDP